MFLVDIFDLSIDVCLKPLIGLDRMIFVVTFMLPVWIDLDIDETIEVLFVGGIGRVIEGVRVYVLERPVDIVTIFVCNGQWPPLNLIH